MNKDYNSYEIMSKIAEDIKDMIKEKYQIDFWYNDLSLDDHDIDGVIVSEGGSRDSWGITIDTQDKDYTDYQMDICIRMKEVK